MKVAGSRGASNEPQLGYVPGLVGLGGDADGEEPDPLVLGLANGGKYVWIPRVRDAVEEQNGNLDAAEGRLLQVDAGEVGDGVGGVGAVAYVDQGGDAGFEILGAPPLVEGLLDDDVAAVLEEGSAGHEAPARLRPEALQPLHHVSGEAFLLGVVLLGTLGAVNQKGQLQAAVFGPQHWKR